MYSLEFTQVQVQAEDL